MIRVFLCILRNIRENKVEDRTHAYGRANIDAWSRGEGTTDVALQNDSAIVQMSCPVASLLNCYCARIPYNMYKYAQVLASNLPRFQQVSSCLVAHTQQRVFFFAILALLRPRDNGRSQAYVGLITVCKWRRINFGRRKRNISTFCHIDGTPWSTTRGIGCLAGVLNSGS